MNRRMLPAAFAAMSAGLTRSNLSESLPRRGTVPDLVSRYESTSCLGYERRKFSGWRSDMKCIAGCGKKAAWLLRALGTRHAAELAAASECRNAYAVPQALLVQGRIKVDSLNAALGLLGRAFFLSSVLREPACAADICRWRKAACPEIASAFCR